ncbi:hypothetical protein D3C86_1450380 [compost metagenome]
MPTCCRGTRPWRRVFSRNCFQFCSTGINERPAPCKVAAFAKALNCCSWSTGTVRGRPPLVPSTIVTRPRSRASCSALWVFNNAASLLRRPNSRAKSATAAARSWSSPRSCSRPPSSTFRSTPNGGVSRTAQRWAMPQALVGLTLDQSHTKCMTVLIALTRFCA